MYMVYRQYIRLFHKNGNIRENAEIFSTADTGRFVQGTIGDEVYRFLTSYFANIGGKINIADNKLTFTVDKA